MADEMEIDREITPTAFDQRTNTKNSQPTIDLKYS